MRTPLGSTIFFLKQVMAMMLACENLPPAFVADAQKLFGYMMSQLSLTMTFVDDLLDLKQL